MRCLSKAIFRNALNALQSVKLAENEPPPSYMLQVNTLFMKILRCMLWKKNKKRHGGKRCQTITGASRTHNKDDTGSIKEVAHVITGVHAKTRMQIKEWGATQNAPFSLSVCFQARSNNIERSALLCH